ncbi:unnamed protein product [Paramecium pentaurelia]|uniref:COMM domain-containing protein n=1 Tax=Paramecium pentaurelia TaxID=43138 RepID=A0A8S1Y0U4_9CILI|nr:unnamed protein product [Paramecium pentaurelia]
MKPIFRGVLIMKYTDNQEEVTLDQLKEYLKEQGNYNEETFSQNVDIFQQLIDDLIQNDSEQTYEQYGISAQELHQTWLTEKDRVLSYYIKKRTQGQKIEKFQWSVNNQFYSKKAKNINKPVCIMNLKSKDVVNKTYKFHTFEINEEDLNYIEDQMKKIEQTINALLL